MLEPVPIEGKCNSKNRDGSLCIHDPMPNGRCYMHGGATPGGELSPHFKHGAYSKYMTANAKSKMEVFERDENLLELREDVALVKKMITDVLEESGNHEAGELWNSLKDALKAYDGAKKVDAEKREAAKEDAFQHIRYLINEGYHEWMSRKEIVNLLEKRANLVEKEQKRIERVGAMMTTGQVVLLVGALKEVIFRNVPDVKVQRRIADEIDELLG